MITPHIVTLRCLWTEELSHLKQTGNTILYYNKNPPFIK